MKQCRSTLTTGILALLLATSAANAGIVTFTDRTDFLDATGATSATGALPDYGTYTANGTTINSVTFYLGTGATKLFIGSSGTGFADWTSLNDGNDIALSGKEDLIAQFAGPVYSAGFDFVEPTAPTDCNVNSSCIDSTFRVDLLSSGSVIDSFQFNAADDVLAFIGVWADEPFDRLVITEIVGGNENEYYGQFYTGTRQRPEGTPVPTPAIGWLFGAGLIGMAASIRRRTN